jgi:hypothetical protein
MDAGTAPPSGPPPRADRTRHAAAERARPRTRQRVVVAANTLSAYGLKSTPHALPSWLAYGTG